MVEQCKTDKLQTLKKSHQSWRIERLPYAAQRAMAWLLDNVDFADKLLQGEKFSDTKIEAYIKKALEKKNYRMLALVMYKQTNDKYVKCSAVGAETIDIVSASKTI